MIIEKEGELLFLSHQNADPDAVGSLFFLKERFGGTIGLPNGVDRKSGPLLEYLGMEYEDRPDPSDYDQIIVVDTPSPEQLSPIEPPLERTIVIDHHNTNLWDIDIYHKKRTSCAEIIYEMFGDDRLSDKEGVGLIAGILTESSGLKRGTPKTFRTLAEIIDASGVNLAKVNNILRSPRPYSEKISRLKGAQRTSFETINGYIIAYATVGAYESSVCEMLLGVGADVSLTASQRYSKFLLSSRARNELIDKGLDLGSIFKSVASMHDTWSGGGHEGAAVIKGEGKTDEALSSAVRQVKNWFSETGLKRELR